MIVERDHIGIFGKMNSGKSTVMNLLTQQQTSIVDPTPGTTTDTKIALQEIHGIGPVKLFDTAGLDEPNVLGEKKRKKVLADLKECDLILLIIDPSTKVFETESEVITLARETDKQLLVIYNIFRPGDEKKIEQIEMRIPPSRFYKKISITAVDMTVRQKLLNFILENFESKNYKMELLPFIKPDQFYILNIPMDIETPQGRYLRPQALCEEYITRNWAYPVSYRMDLAKARNNDPQEKTRFESFLANFKKRPLAIITDSQAMDIMNSWTPRDIELTTFSIMMINYASRGHLAEFVEGIKIVDTLKTGDEILIAEACNHSRIGEDIGTVQIPNYLKSKFNGIVIEHNFGREFQENEHLSEYKLLIHCGGCMISYQKLLARLRDLRMTGVPYTNYGIFLAYTQGKQALARVLKPWNIKPNL